MIFLMILLSTPPITEGHEPRMPSLFAISGGSRWGLISGFPGRATVTIETRAKST